VEDEPETGEYLGMRRTGAPSSLQRQSARERARDLRDKPAGKPVTTFTVAPDVCAFPGCQPLLTHKKEGSVNRLMIIARLRDGAQQEAEDLIAAGPPFDLEELGFHRHAAYLTAGEVVFLFEAPEVEWIVNDIVDDVVISAAFGPWHKLIDGPPRFAHERFFWSRESNKLGVGLGL
jgi:hypothetical protein